MSRHPEAEVVRRARAGDDGALRELYDRHAAAVGAVCRRLLSSDELAEDAAQEAWIRAFGSLPGFRGECTFGTWVYRIAINQALAVRRQSTRWRLVHRPWPVDRSDPPTRTAPPLLRIRLMRAIRSLPTGMRLVLELHDVEGYTHREIGDRLGISEGTSKSQLSRARQRLRGDLRTSYAEVNAA